MTIAALFRERTGLDLGEIAGSTVGGEIPISDVLVNKMLAQTLARHAQIGSLRIQAQPNDSMAIQVVPRARLMPPMNLTARIERQPEFPDHPMLLLRWSMPAAGPLALFAAPMLSFFNAMPPGIRMDGDRVAVDLRELLRSRGLDDVIAFVRKLEVHTRQGGFVLRFEAAT